MELKKALEELRKEPARKFDQTVDLIVNLKGIDLRKHNISLVVTLPHPFKEKKVCAFITRKSEIVKSIMKPDFAKYNDKKAMKNLVKEYDFFIAHSSLMPSVATTFGKVLGPTGKMPSPQLGVLMQDTDDEINNLLKKISKSAKIRVKEASVKIAVGKTAMKDEQVIENIKAIYESLVNALPTKKENVRKALIKFTMTKPVEVEIK